MKFTLKNPAEENIYNLLRKVGYHLTEKGEKKSKLIFIRPPNRNGYPRFHLYIKLQRENLLFNLHLDQKKPSYKGVPAHSGEYEGEIVENEAERIKQSLK
jgi:hypothetical protein